MPIFIPMKHTLTLLCLLLHTLLPAQENHALQLPGLKDPVEVLRDEWGVNHIYAKNQHDLFFTQGYCAAKDRLFLLYPGKNHETYERATGAAAGTVGIILLVLGGILLLTSVVSFCPLYVLLGIRTCRKD